jgi:hypothetical protein
VRLVNSSVSRRNKQPMTVPDRRRSRSAMPRLAWPHDSRIIGGRIAAGGGARQRRSVSSGTPNRAVLTMIKKALRVRFLLMSQADRMAHNWQRAVDVSVEKPTRLVDNFAKWPGCLPIQGRLRGFSTITQVGLGLKCTFSGLRPGPE